MSIGIEQLASTATAIGVVVATYQLAQGRRQLREGFERSFVDRFERIIACVDLEILLDGGSIDHDDRSLMRALYDYFQLCEEELYFRAHRRVSRSTWHDWWYGIRIVLTVPEVAAAFTALKHRAEQRSGTTHFTYLSVALHGISDTKYEPQRVPLVTRLT